MLNLQAPRRREIGAPGDQRLGSIIGNVLGAPAGGGFGQSFDPRGRPWVLNNAPQAAQAMPEGQRAPSEVEKAATFIDPSPADLQPVNAPGGNQPTPASTRPNYRQILEEALGPRPKMNTLQTIASIVGPALMDWSGNEAGANQMRQMIGAPMRDWDERNRQAKLEAIKWQRDDDVAAAKRAEPQFFSGSEDRVRYDPTSGTSTRVYDAPQDFEDYAGVSGHEPGTPEYFQAAQDYVLRGNGPTAFKYDRDLEAVRNAARMSLENTRQQNRLGVEGVRQTNRQGLIDYRNQNPAPARPRASSGSPRETLPVVSTPAEALKLPPGTRFKVKGSNAVKVRP